MKQISLKYSFHKTKKHLSWGMHLIIIKYWDLAASLNTLILNYLQQL